MAQAGKQLFPDGKLAIGPAIEDGFYYDFAKPEPFTSEDLLRIEQRMSEIIVKDLPFVREERPREAAIRFFEEQGEPFKVEILKGIDAATVSLYRQGDFVDLCRGPHAPSTGHIRAFKLLSCSGAYWRGSEKNPMLQRIYGTAWLSREDLDKYLWRLEGAKKRDPRKLGAGARPLRLPGCLPGGRVLAAQGDGHLPRAGALLAGRARRAGVPGDLHARPGSQAAVGAVGTLGSLPGEHVLGGGGGAALQPQADELPPLPPRPPP